MSRLWTEREDRTLRDLWARDIIADEIAYRMKRSAQGVLNRARVLGLPSRKMATPRTHSLRVKLSEAEHRAVSMLSAKRKRPISAIVRQALVATAGPIFAEATRETQRPKILTRRRR